MLLHVGDPPVVRGIVEHHVVHFLLVGLRDVASSSLSFELHESPAFAGFGMSLDLVEGLRRSILAVSVDQSPALGPVVVAPLTHVFLRIPEGNILGSVSAN